VVSPRWFIPGAPVGLSSDARVVVREVRKRDKRIRVERDDGRQGSWWLDFDSVRRPGYDGFAGRVEPKSWSAPGRFSRITTTAHVSRGGTGVNAFRACVLVGRQKSGSRHADPLLHLARQTFCARGKNPREALGRALVLGGESIKKRSGAFAGLAGYSKSNRKSRRIRRRSKRY